MAMAPHLRLGSRGGRRGLGGLLWFWPLRPELSAALQAAFSRRFLLRDVGEERRWRLRRAARPVLSLTVGGCYVDLGKNPFLLVPRRPPAVGQLSSCEQSSEVKSVGFG